MKMIIALMYSQLYIFRRKKETKRKQKGIQKLENTSIELPLPIISFGNQPNYHE